MKILIRSLINEVISIDVEPKDTIKLIKEKICSLLGIPLSEQRIFFEERELEDESTVYNNKLVEGSILLLILRPFSDHPEINEFNINIIDIKNRISLSLELLSQSEKIKKCKKIIEKKTGIPSSQQILLDAHRTILEDDKTFKDYDIEKNSTIVLTSKFPSFERQSARIESLEERILELENQIEKEKKENIVLKNKIKYLEKENFENNSQISLRNGLSTDELFKLMKQLREKEEEIKELKSTMQFNLKPGEKLISVIFVSVDQKIHYSLICKNTDIFSTVENLLYKEFPEYKETENYFILNGVKINKYKSLEENKIKNNSIITLNIYD